MAFYHFYRPQNFSDIFLTQNSVAYELALAVLKNKIGHAYLFTGTHGIGKTSTARILAKAVNCEKLAKLHKTKHSFENKEKVIEECVVPCNECDGCKNITNGSCIDVVEMDAASNRGIDEIRELKEKIYLSPASVPKKVYIIDEVHMLTTEAFNALLKTLEEPPEHAVFILCTTELHKVPLTIQSRCSKVVFKKPGSKEITTLLDKIAKAEGIKIDDKARTVIAQKSGGAFRDAVKLLEQLSLSGEPITAELVNQVSTGSSHSDISLLLTALTQQTSPEVLKVIAGLEQKGVNFTEFIKELLEVVRAFLLAKSGVHMEIISDEQYSPFVQAFDLATLTAFIEHLLKALSQQKTTPFPSLPLELAVLKISKAPELRKPAVKNAATNVVVQNVQPVAVKSTPAAAPPSVKKMVPEVEKVEEPEPVVEVTGDVVVPTVAGTLTFDDVQIRWTEIVKFVKTYNALLAALLRQCKPAQLDGKVLILETAHRFHKDQIESPKNRTVIEQSLFELLGAQLRVRGTLVNSKLTQKQIDNIKEVSNDDLLVVAQEIFGA